MTVLFKSHWAADLQAFLQFKRGLGYRYARAEYTLREFDRFLCRDAERHRVEELDRAILAWLASKPQRKAVSVSMDAAVLRPLLSKRVG